MKKLHGLGFGGLLLLLGILTGCSQLFPNDPLEDSSDTPELSGTSTWLIAAQGQGGPPACVRDLAPGQAKKLADKTLKENPEVQALAQHLKGKGKKLNTFKAHGCKVKNDNTNGQELRAMQDTTTEATLVEVPAGSDAALYLLENEALGESNYWASIKEANEGGERLVHIETGLSEGTEEARLFLPDGQGTQEVATGLQQLLGQSATTSAGVQAMQSEGVDWSQAQVILDESNAVIAEDGSEELEALVVVPLAG